jgi:hypothetical protein
MIGPLGLGFVHQAVAVPATRAGTVDETQLQPLTGAHLARPIWAVA